MSDVNNDGPEKWVPEAIAEQEEGLKRWKSCLGQLGLPHTWQTVSEPGGLEYEACVRCQVTRTPEDYRTKLALS